MNDFPLGIFDSGLGGLTAMSRLRSLAPDKDIVYFADTANMPYGEQSVGKLRFMAQKNMELLAKNGAKAIIAACGTVSSVAVDVLDAFPLPVFNVVDSSVEAMAKIDNPAPVGIIATDASMKSGVYRDRLKNRCPEKEIIDYPTQGFVRIIESGHTSPDDPIVISAVEHYLMPMKEKNICALLLGCTHFGLIGEAISRFLGPDVRLISASGCAAEQAYEYLKAAGSQKGSGEEIYFTSGSVEQFISLASRFLGRDIGGKVFHVENMGDLFDDRGRDL